MEISGKVKVIGETEVVGSAGTFKKRTIVVSSDEQYIQHVPIDFVQDKTSILDNYSVGQQVKVSVNVRGNEYNGKYYVSLNGWKIEKLGDAPVTSEPVKNEEPANDLPF